MAWNASTGSNISGYKIYYGTSSRNYAYNVNVGKSTSASLSGLQEGRKYYFAATAYTSSAESNYSSELAYTVPTA
ncbi:MAG: fibronectin type III domain-containing protein, partial [Desulfobacterales bacterium]